MRAAHGHKACSILTEKNQLEIVGQKNKNTKLFFASLLTWHSFDHYGQLAVYARSNGVVPPASRPNN